MIQPSLQSKKHARAAHRLAHVSGIALFIFALLFAPVAQHAQSGRNREQPATNKNSSPNSARSKRSNSNSGTQTTAPNERARTTTVRDAATRDNAPAPTATPGTSSVVPNPVTSGATNVKASTPTPQPTPSVNAASAQTNGTAATAGEEVDPEDVVRINSNLVTVPASVIDATGHAITDLKLVDFELRVDGQPKPIADLGYSDTPVRLALLFDNSSSLTAAREFEKQAAIKFFKSVMRPIDRAAVYSVSTYPILEQPLTGDVKWLTRTIENFGKPEGATALFDAIAQAIVYLKPFEGRKAIILVSDGADTLSDITFEATMQRALSSDVQIFAVQTGQIENANLRDLVAERRLQELTAQTGGAVYVPKGTSDLDAAFAQISADLAQQYVLSYYPSDDRRDGRFRIISLRVATRPNLRVRARRGYYSPKS